MRTVGELNRSVVEEISERKGEPRWMRSIRLKAWELFQELKDPLWLPGIQELNLDEMILYHGVDVQAHDWDELPPDIRRYYEELNLPEQEKRFLAGLATALDSDTIYSRVKEFLEKKGVILEPMEEAVKKYPDLVKRYFGRVFPPAEHRYSALHYALWSGGVFVYVPPGVKVEFPLEAFFLVANELLAQFEHSLIVVGENAYVHFIEGCSSPQFRKYAFHDGVVEAYVHRGGHLRFTTVQNWGKNLINFNNKRTIVEEGGTVEWVEGSFGSRASYVYPSFVLQKGSKLDYRAFTISHKDEWKEGGVKVFHTGKNGRSHVVSKSVSMENGVSVFRGLLKVNKGAENTKSSMSCDSLLLDKDSKAFTYPHNQVEEPSAQISYEATTSFLTEDQLFYLESRGFSEDESRALIVSGFLAEVIEKLPVEYGAVFKKVLEMDFRGSVG